MINPADTNSIQYWGNFNGIAPERIRVGQSIRGQFPPEIDGVTEKEKASPGTVEKKGFKECQACKKRKYMDVSDDPNVSFKAPTSLPPEAAATAVAAHENEHVRHESMNAARLGRKVVYQSVQIYTAVCPECGRTYVSGGKTTTATASKPNPDSYLGKNLDRQI